MPTFPTDPPAPSEEPITGAPAIPSFASLRAPRRRSAVDVLLPDSPAPSRVRIPAAAPRPAEYRDLWRFGVRTGRAVAGLPFRVAGWAVRTPLTWAGRLLGR